MGGMGFTPIRATAITSDTAFDNKFLAGIIITTNGTASTTHIRNGQLVSDSILMTFIIEAVTGGTTRIYPFPGMVIPSSGGFFVDVDVNVTLATVLHG